MNSFEKSSIQSKIIYLFIFCFAGLFLAASVVGLLNVAWNEIMSSAWGVRLSSGIQLTLMFFLPAITLLLWSNEKPTTSLGIKNTNNWILLSVLSIIILTVSMPMISLVNQLNQQLVLPNWLDNVESWMRNLEDAAKETTDLLLSGPSLLDYLGNIFFISFIAAIAEETFFRGVLQKLLISRFVNFHTGIWLAAFIFSLMHMQFYGFFPRLILGAMLGYLFYWSNRLWIPILVHFLNNAWVVTFTYFWSNSSFYEKLENQPISIFYILIGCISLFTLVYFLFIFKRESLKPSL